ncbi:MAG TPA: iron-containing alcohol dehydrogenase [Phycisphaerae bacterium]|nr:iron-containing alcohol dehydrogenase [Phycisphaerae bacterium]
MTFEFATAARIIFGNGSLSEAGPIALSLLGNVRKGKVMLVSGVSTSRPSRLTAILAKHDIEFVTLPVTGEPTVEMVRTAADRAVVSNCRIVISIGGGSAIDAGKAIAAMITNGGNPTEFLEVIGQGKPLSQPPVPFIAIPTTAGTGAEVTRNAVLVSTPHRLKVSLRSPLMLPRVALVDPELTYDLPPALTAATGLDALTQLIEAFVSVRANPLTDGFCREGIPRIARSLREVCEDGECAIAREDMALASLLSGLALANAGLGAAHGIAAPLGGRFAAPHGAVCAALLPHVITVNVAAIRRAAPQSESLRRYDEVGRMLTGSASAVAADAIRWTSEVNRDLGIPRLGSYGIRPIDIPSLAEGARSASSMKGNPVVLTSEEVCAIVTAAL